MVTSNDAVILYLKDYRMYRFAISGSWRNVNQEILCDVRSDVQGLLSEGHTIVTGGALGVDFLATEEAIQSGQGKSQLIVVLPTTLLIYSAHYMRRADEGVISPDTAKSLINQLERVKRLSPSALVELPYETVDEQSYYARNTEVIALSDGLFAYHVNSSGGVQDAINKARSKRIPVRLRTYFL